MFNLNKKLFIKKSNALGALLFGLIVFACFIPIKPVKAEEIAPEVKPSAIVTAFIESKASKVESSIEIIGPSEILADNNNQAVVRVVIKDQGAEKMEGIPVKLRSNRGEIDEIEPKSKETDENGQAIFKIKTKVAGQSTIFGIADTYLDLDDSVTITWKPLPISQPAKVSIDNPFSDTNITVIDSPILNTDPLVNPEREFIIPFWMPLIFAILFFAFLITLIYLILTLKRIRVFEAKEALMLEKEGELISKEEQIIEQISKNS